MKKTTIQILSIILAMGMLSSCNNADLKSDTAKSTEPVEMVTAEIPEKPEETEPQEIERASFSNGQYTVTVEDKEIIYSVKEIIDDIIENGTVIDKSMIEPRAGCGSSELPWITYVDNGNTVKIKQGMTLKSDSEYNVPGNEVIKINAKYYVVSSDVYNELMSLYRQGRATENDSEETETQSQEIERASFDYGGNVITIEDKDTIYYVKNLVDDLLDNGELIDKDSYHVSGGDTCGGEESITYVDAGKTIRIKWRFSVSDSERYVLKINSEYYWMDSENYVDLVSLFERSYPCEDEAERWQMEFTNGDEIIKISDKDIVSRAEVIYHTLFYDLIETEKVEIKQDENTKPQGMQFSYGNGVTKRIEWNFYAPSSEKYDDRVIFRETYSFDSEEEDSVHYLSVSPEHYHMLMDLYESGIS